MRAARAFSMLLAIAMFAGCNGLQDIDRRIARVLEDSEFSIDEEVGPRYVVPDGTTREDAPWTAYDETPGTDNPSADALVVDRATRREAEDVIKRLQGYSEVSENARHLDLQSALGYAVRNSPEYRFAEEEYVLVVLNLLIERHLWGPRFFNDTTAGISSIPTSGRYDTAARLVNDFVVTQRLPYGGDVSVRAVARATEDLHEFVAGERTNSASVILSADIPLLRGAGMAAREDLIQRERDVIYAARTFARFRRDFLFQISRDYLDLVVDQQSIENAERAVESAQQLEARQQALSDAGRTTPIELAEAQNLTLSRIDNVNASFERFRLNLDRFKVRLGMPVEEPLTIERKYLELPLPEVTLDSAVYVALEYRLDLQTERDRVADARRRVDVARNQLLGDLDVNASVAFLTDPDRGRAGVDFELDETEFQAGVTYSWPLDRKIEQARLRQVQVRYGRAERDYDTLRDDVASRVRAAVRGIDTALLSVRLQERNVATAELGEESIAADPGRATITQQTDAINRTFLARDALDSSRRDLDVAVLFYLLESGQLRVSDDGELIPVAPLLSGDGGGG